MKNITDIENKMRQDASNSSFEFKESFWNEMSNNLDGADADGALKNSAQTKSQFAYKDSYWDEVNALLNRRDRNKALLLYGSIAASLVLIVTIGLLNYSLEYSMAQNNDLNVNSGFVINKLGDSRFGSSESVKGNENISGNNEDAFLLKSSSLSKKSRVNQSKRNHKIENKAISLEANSSLVIQDVSSDVPANNRASNDVQRLSDMSVSRVQIDDYNKKDRTYRSLITLNSKSARQTRSHIFIHAGAMMANAPTGNVSNRKNIGFGFKGGIGYSLVKNNWGLETGMNFLYRNAINHKYSESTKIYGSRLFEIQNTSTYNSMMSLEVPLTATYSIKRHRIGLGVSGVYNFAVNSTLRKYDDYNENEEIIRNNYGVNKGITPFDFRVHINYEYQLNSKFSIGANGQFGTINQIDKTIISETNGYRDINATVFLKFNLFKL